MPISDIFTQALELKEAIREGLEANRALKGRFSNVIEDVVECPSDLAELVISFINPIELSIAEN